VTVRANDIALCDLVIYCLPASHAHALTDIELLVEQVIELQDQGITLTAVNTRAHTKELNDVFGALSGQMLFAADRPLDVELFTFYVTLVLIPSSAVPAVSVASSAISSTPAELRDGLHVVASAAPARRFRRPTHKRL
jgi:hypothetical protein